VLGLRFVGFFQIWKFPTNLAYGIFVNILGFSDLLLRMARQPHIEDLAIARYFAGASGAEFGGSTITWGGFCLDAMIACRRVWLS
jgi:hypothetical protein